MNILTINSWSSSLKYKVFEMPKEKLITKWQIDKIWFDKWKFKNHKEAIKSIIDKFENISAIWHRVVHWWDEFSKPTIITDKVIKSINKFSELAPLHNPANIEWILACQKIFKNIPQIAIFDTAFNQTMPAENYTYAIPYKYYEKYKIRRYWFHGTSHQYVFQEAKKIKKSNKNIKTNKTISCHIWNWASISAILNWKVIENSMGFTPLAWLTMWTRSWDIDPEIILYLMKKENLTPEQMDTILNKESWILWIQQHTNHMKTITNEYEDWKKQSTLTFKIYINSIIKYIWAYAAILNWVDTIIFTGWVLEKPLKEPATIREEICEKLTYLWINFNKKSNEKKYTWTQIITKKESKTTVIIIPTNEELMIAKQTFELINQT